MLFTLAEFWEDLGVTQAEFYLPDRRMVEEDGNGPIAPMQYGQRVWQGSVSIRPYPHAVGRKVDAKIEAMKEADSTFLLSPSDRNPNALGSGTVGSIGADRRNITLDGFAASDGDYIGISNASVYSLHQVFATDGETLKVVPPLPLAISAGDAATAEKPLAKAVIGIDAKGPTFSAVNTNTFSFDFYTVLA